jgi:hypothetical protein
MTLFKLIIMENKYSKIVSKKDFNIDEFIQAYLLKHHNDETYTTYMLAVFVDASDINNCGWMALQQNQILKDGKE